MSQCYLRCLDEDEHEATDIVQVAGFSNRPASTPGRGGTHFAGKRDREERKKNDQELSIHALSKTKNSVKWKRAVEYDEDEERTQTPQEGSDSEVEHSLGSQNIDIPDKEEDERIIRPAMRAVGKCFYHAFGYPGPYLEGKRKCRFTHNKVPYGHCKREKKSNDDGDESTTTSTVAALPHDELLAVEIYQAEWKEDERICTKRHSFKMSSDRSASE